MINWWVNHLIRKEQQRISWGGRADYGKWCYCSTCPIGKLPLHLRTPVCPDPVDYAQL